MLGFSKIARSYIKNIPGWSTSQKFLLVESDDWGSIRMPSNETYTYLLRKGFIDDKSNFLKYDTLASVEDFNLLFDTLSSFKDKNQNSAILSPFVCLSNPDFERIKASDYREYYLQPFTETLDHYYNENVFSKWQEGIEKGVFVPQFHGREHFNVPQLMHLLSNRNHPFFDSFNLGVVHIPIKDIKPSALGSLAPAYYVPNRKDLAIYEQSLEEGVSLFKMIFKKTPVSFAAPNGIFHPILEKVLADKGVRGLVVNKVRVEPDLEGGLKNRNFFWKYGSRNKQNQIYYRRNVKFEPVQRGYNLKQTLFEIDAAFKMGKPAVVSSHRLNYIGVLSSDHRDKNIDELFKLLSLVVKKHPDVEFLSSSDLVNMIDYKAS